MSWDAANGVWMGDKAQGQDLSLPTPLYLFGYGSLIWRSGDLLAGKSSYHCVCQGWSRVFAQRSMDHRGNPVFPGLVLNLVSDAYMEANHHRHSSADPSHCIGVLYHIPESDAEKIVEELDFRERGGYQKTIVRVKLLQDALLHKAGDCVDALVYVGSSENPNFIVDPSNDWYSRKVNIISAAYGPSGYNREYLFPLVRFFHDHQYDDPYLRQLNHDVRLRLGKWRGREIMYRSEDANTFVSSISMLSSVSRLSATQPLHVWGSDDYGQLSLAGCSVTAGDQDNVYSAVAIGSISDVFPSMDLSVYPHEVILYAGGVHSACLVADTLYIWGAKNSSTPIPSKIPSRVSGASLGHEHSLVLLDTGLVLSFGADKFGQCTGGEAGAPYFLKHIADWPDIMLNDEVARPMATTVLHYWTDFVKNASTGIFDDNNGERRAKIIQVCAGVRHSAAITEDGELYSWGGGRHSRSLLCGPLPWLPEVFSGGSKRSSVVDVALGLNHTVALDSLGQVWAWGSSNKHGQLGRDDSCGIEPMQVRLPSGIIWQRVCSTVMVVTF